MFDTIRSTVEAFTKMRIGPWHGLGDVLLVGEGNLSFAKSLLKLAQASVTHMMATVFEKDKDLAEDTIRNAEILRCAGGEVLSSVDATKLDEHFKPQQFDTIIFQFPNVASRDAKHGRNPNHVMIRRFLRSATNHLKLDGKALITAVDNSHYQGVFGFDDSAAFAGYEEPQSYPFDPSMFPGYSHTNTNDDDSALDEHNRFATWVFRLKE